MNSSFCRIIHYQLPCLVIAAVHVCLGDSSDFKNSSSISLWGSVLFLFSTFFPLISAEQCGRTASQNSKNSRWNDLSLPQFKVTFVSLTLFAIAPSLNVTSHSVTLSREDGDGWLGRQSVSSLLSAKVTMFYIPSHTKTQHWFLLTAKRIFLKPQPSRFSSLNLNHECVWSENTRHWQGWGLVGPLAGESSLQCQSFVHLSIPPNPRRWMSTWTIFSTFNKRPFFSRGQSWISGQ